MDDSPIKRSNVLEKALFVASALSPKVTGITPMPYVFHPISQSRRDLLSLRRYSLDNSSTFSIALNTMNDVPEIRDDLLVVHQLFKVLDFIDEKPDVQRREKKSLHEDYFEVIRYPEEDKIEDLERRLEVLGFNDADIEHSTLVENIRVLIRAAQDRPNKVRDIFLKYGTKMAEGFAKTDKKPILDMRDVDLDTLIAAGYVGYTVLEIFEARKYLTSGEADRLKTPARTLGKADQLGNNLRDFFKDLKADISHWPEETLQKFKEALEIEPIRMRQRRLRELYPNFSALVHYSADKFYKGVDFIDRLPKGRPYGPAVFSGLGLAVYADYARRVDNPEFLATEGVYERPTKGEIFDLKDAVTGLVREGSSIRSLIRHLLDTKEPSTTFRHRSRRYNKAA